MEQDYLYKIRPRGESLVTVSYRSGVVYKRVPEAAVRKILEAKAGRVVDE
jgi:(2Fe-2S) ferredoxin